MIYRIIAAITEVLLYSGATWIGALALSQAVSAAQLEVQSVTRVHDGDTFTVDLLNCPYPVLCDDVGVRILGIDTPELGDKRPDIKVLSLKARAALKQLVSPPHQVRLLATKRDKYFRILATVESDGVNVGDRLISMGLARPYTGTGPHPW